MSPAVRRRSVAGRGLPAVVTVLGALVALVAGVVAGVVPAAAVTVATTPTTTAAAPTVSVAPALRWRPCGASLECATLAVPLDRSAPDGRTIDLALVRAPARVPAQRVGSLLVNPGGPGASGVDYVRDALATFDPTLRDRFDVVGFDPRGTGASSPVDCGADMDAFWAIDSSPATEAEWNALVAGTQAFVDACVRNAGDLLAHVATADTVADLEDLRVALGEDRLTYLGFSYGTLLGARYAEAHPDRVRAFVLDGAVDPALDAADVQVQQAVGFERVLGQFFDWCGSRRSCAFHSGGDPERAYRRLIARVDREGLEVPGARPARTLSRNELDVGVSVVLYDGRAGFRELGDVLAAARGGDGGPLADLADLYTERLDVGDYGTIQDAFLAISCADGPAVGGLAGARAIAARAAVEAPLLGPGIVNNTLACAIWPVVAPAASPVRPVPDAAILVVGTEHDPATPLAWARSLARELDAPLLTAPGAQHTAFQMGNDCVDVEVVRILVTGRRPKGDLVC